MRFFKSINNPEYGYFDRYEEEEKEISLFSSRDCLMIILFMLVFCIANIILLSFVNVLWSAIIAISIAIIITFIINMIIKNKENKE